MTEANDPDGALALEQTIAQRLAEVEGTEHHPDYALERHHTGPESPHAVETAPAAVVQKRRVVMSSVSKLRDGSLANLEAVDYVPVDILDQYVTDAQQHWQSVVVPQPDHHDPGPAGDTGDTHYPEFTDHPLAGQTVSGAEGA